MAPTSNTKQLEHVYNYYGPKSKEFYSQIEKYIYYLLNRYFKNYTDTPEKDDVVQLCFIRVYEKIENFDPSKGNLATFLHTTIRNKITNYRSELHRHKKLFNSSKDLENINELSSIEDFKSEEDFGAIDEDIDMEVDSIDLICSINIEDHKDCLEDNNSDTIQLLSSIQFSLNEDIKSPFNTLFESGIKFTDIFIHKYFSNILVYSPLKKLEKWNQITSIV